MEKTDIQRLRDIPIRSLCGLLGIEVDERGRCLCPFHDDHHLGSCYVGVRGHNTLSCWSCGKRGVDTIALTQHVLGKGFLEACQYLAEQYGCTPGPLGPRPPSPRPPSPLKGEKIHLDGRPPSPLKGEKIHVNTGTFGTPGHVNTGTIGGMRHVITGTIGGAGHMNTGTIGASTSSNYSPLRGLGGPVGGPVGPVGLRPTLSRHFIHPVLNDAARHFLYDERHISPRVASWYRLNSWTDRHGTPWLELPYYSAEGRLIGVQNRRLSPCPVTSPLGISPLGTSSLGTSPLSTSPSTPLPSCPVTSLPSCPQTSPLPLREGQGGGSSSSPRFLFQPGSRTSTFGLQIIPYLRPTDELWIAEGPTDLLAMASAGHRGIAIASATLIRPEDFLPLKERGILRWRMVHDNDSAGLQARDRIIQLANQLGASITATPPPAPCKDFGEWWAKENEKSGKLKVKN